MTTRVGRNVKKRQNNAPALIPPLPTYATSPAVPNDLVECLLDELLATAVEENIRHVAGLVGLVGKHREHCPLREVVSQLGRRIVSPFKSDDKLDAVCRAACGNTMIMWRSARDPRHAETWVCR